MLTKTKRAYIGYWVVLLITAEGIMLLFNQWLVLSYLIVALLFLGAFFLRAIGRYPGKPEPLVLDASAVVLAVVFGYAAYVLRGSHARFLLLLTSSVIIMPHIIYIIREDNP